MYSNPRFRKWIELETAKQSISKATEGVEFPDRVFGYLSVAFGKTPKEEGYWKNTVFSLKESLESLTVDIPVPMMRNPGKDGKTPDWDYEGRMWNYLAHVLAGAYGWTLEYIANLDVVEAFGHIQEILTTEHLEHEFFYSLSEVAYPYNKSTKKSEFRPMSRPHWMRPVRKITKTIRIRRDMLPVGYGVDTSGLGEELGGWNELIKNNEAKETDTSRDTQSVPDSS